MISWTLAGSILSCAGVTSKTTSVAGFTQAGAMQSRSKTLDIQPSRAQTLAKHYTKKQWD
eukprot:CAMPEP_0171124348 /NCGR_PEP_ID=MMETSP0766_2-20121228/108982_1 /TAXON_ID=439317 /ORGANISM="Gambierdiscus australes, Strain CAWD 149" /LENGTH=59 /DNA_ID=CAMNT_0011587265 /DNA_START=56 /DNA_END=233 /DNA_ORIENTATION=-